MSMEADSQSKTESPLFANARTHTSRRTATQRQFSHNLKMTKNDSQSKCTELTFKS